MRKDGVLVLWMAEISSVGGVYILPGMTHFAIKAGHVSRGRNSRSERHLQQMLNSYRKFMRLKICRLKI